MLKQFKHLKNYLWNSPFHIKYYGLFVILVGLTSGCVSNYSLYSTQDSMQVKQVLEDNKLEVDGLGGARVVALTPDGSQLLVASADDNSLAIFNVDADSQLLFIG